LRKCFLEGAVGAEGEAGVVVVGNGD